MFGSDDKYHLGSSFDREKQIVINVTVLSNFDLGSSFDKERLNKISTKVGQQMKFRMNSCCLHKGDITSNVSSRSSAFFFIR